MVSGKAPRRTLLLVPRAAAGGVGLVVLGGGRRADERPARARAPLAGGEWLPFPPRIEVSSLGDAAVLTGALAVGRRAALDNVFVNRRPTPAR